MDENPKKETAEEKKEGENIITEEQIEKSIIEVNEKKRKKGNYITGTIGAIVGAIITTVPLILRYMYARNNFAITLICALCTSLISGGALLGYKIFRGKIGKKLPVILTIVSLLVITIVTTIICPIILMIEFSYPVTFENWINLYSDTRADVRASIIEDLVVGVIVTIISNIIVIRSTKRARKNEISRQKLQLMKQVREQSMMIKKACIGLNVMSSQNTITEQELINELEMIYGVKRKDAKKYFKTCAKYKLLKKNKGKYYYDDIDEKNILENIGEKKRRHIPKIVKIIIILAIIIAIVAYVIIIKIKEMPIQLGDNIKLNIADNQELYDTVEEITENFNEDTALAFDFIVKDSEANKYDIYAQLIPKSNYIGYDFATIINEEREYFIPLMGEEDTSEVHDKTFNERAFKVFYFNYGENNKYRLYIYLYEGSADYLWVNMYTDSDLEMEKADSIMENLFK